VFEAIVTLVLVNNGKPRRIDKNIEKLILSIL